MIKPTLWRKAVIINTFVFQDGPRVLRGVNKISNNRNQYGQYNSGNIKMLLLYLDNVYYCSHLR